MHEKSRTENRWYFSGWSILGAALVFPPAGLILLWGRRGTGILRKALLTPLILILSVAHLFLFYGLKVEMDGSGMRPIFSFRSMQNDLQSLELQRQSAATDQPSLPGGNYWTDFLGPLRNGHYTEMPISTSWPAGGLKPLYRQPIGGGYASFSIAQGRAYTIEQRRDQEFVVAYALGTGRELWTHSYAAHFQESMGGPGPRATPTWHDGRIYSLGATGEFRCLDAATGTPIWSKNILSENNVKNLTWGMAASPLIVDDKVIVLPGGRDSSVVAYDKLTGKPVWKALSDAAAYTSPMLANLAGQRQLIVVTAERMMGLTVEEGKLLWEYPWKTEYNASVAQPVVTDASHVFISAGYDHGAALLEIVREGDRFTAREAWKNRQMKNKFNSSVLFAGHLYGLDESILTCIEVKTGERKWKGGRYGYGQLLLAGGHLLITTEQGELALVRAAPEGHEELARFAVLDGKTWNVPAIGDGILLMRNTREMAALRVGKLIQ